MRFKWLLPLLLLVSGCDNSDRHDMRELHDLMAKETMENDHLELLNFPLKERGVRMMALVSRAWVTIDNQFLTAHPAVGPVARDVVERHRNCARLNAETCEAFVKAVHFELSDEEKKRMRSLTNEEMAIAGEITALAQPPLRGP
jgi:hypothetical protein